MTTAPPAISPALPPPDGSLVDSRVSLDDWPAELRRYRLGLGLYVAAVVMLFVAFSSAYIVRRGVPSFETTTGTYSLNWETLQLPLGLLSINTLLLAGASAAAEFGRRKGSAWAHGGREETSSTSRWIGVALLLTLGFVLGQGIAWRSFEQSGLVLSSGARTAFFYLLTGTHAIHAIVGIGILAWIAGRYSRWQPTRRLIAVDLTAWYLHSMTVLWVYLFVFLTIA
jgi:cytochrome c oxidase subunit III